MGWPVGVTQPQELIERRAAANRRPLIVRFERYIMPEPNSGCWLWTGSVDRKGYGQLREGRHLRYATHVALELIGIGVPPGGIVMHKCDTPPCVNPDHLRVGTNAENAADCIAKGRQNRTGLALGWGHNRARPETVVILRQCFDAGISTVKAGKAAGVSQGAAWTYYKRWRQ